jgi:hypothetical protein
MRLAFLFDLRSAKHGTMRQDLQWGGQRSSGSGLVDVLDRVLDKGLVIAGDITISLAQVELLTIRIRLIVCSLDKAQEVGLDWWKYDHHLSGAKQPLRAENESLRKQIQTLERKVAQLAEDNVAGRQQEVALGPAPGALVEESTEAGGGMLPTSAEAVPQRRARSEVPAGPGKRQR